MVLEDRLKTRAWYKKEKRMAPVIIMNPSTVAIPYSCGNDVLQLDYEDVIMMQCTGLKDKEGTLIFEGDILKTVGDNRFSTRYRLARIGIAFVFINLNNFQLPLSSTSNDFTSLVILGNIHNNPELLTDK